MPLPERLSAESYHQMRRAMLGRHEGRTVVLDCTRLAGDDALHAARLVRLVLDARAAGREARLTGLPPALRQTLAEMDAALLDEESPPRAHPIEAIGAWALRARDGAVGVATLLRETGGRLVEPFGHKGIKWDRVLGQVAVIGADAVPIVVFISVLLGVVLALNGAQQLRQFGAAIFVANLVAISMTREMAPLVTAIVVAGRSGSAIAAEIGTMVVSEELDAMRTMALNPVRFLVVPKLVALALVLPLLTTLSNAAGIAGGWAVGAFGLGLGSSAYASQTVQALFVSDVVTGLVKSVVFAILIGVVAVRRGLTVEGGPEAVGRATTATVVTAIVLCILANAGFTAFFYVTE